MALAQALDNLRKNKDFKKVFTEGYFRDEPARLCMFLANPECHDPAMRKRVKRDIDSVGAMFQYFRTVFIQGNQAAAAIENAKEAVEIINAEEDGEVPIDDDGDEIRHGNEA